jgi:hypothetical protein
MDASSWVVVIKSEYCMGKALNRGEMLTHWNTIDSSLDIRSSK